MSWPLPTPDEIAARAAGHIEARYPDMDARSPDTAAGVIAGTVATSTYDVWLYMVRTALELMPDTAIDWLERHASIHGIPRQSASAASGTVRLTGSPGLVLPSGIALRSRTGARFATTAGGTIGGGGAIDLPVIASETGAAGNLATDAVLDLVSPVAGLATQVATVVSPGLSGGYGAEDDGELRARLLQRIREPPAGGSRGDYEGWARQAVGVAYVSVLSASPAPGSVGIVIAMEGPAVAGAGDLDRVAAIIEEVRPVTASVTVGAAELLPVNLTIALSPDTAAIRSAVGAALAAFFRSEARIGATLPRSRISEAISAAAGEYSHRIDSPGADVAPAAMQLPVLGTLAWTAY